VLKIHKIDRWNKVYETMCIKLDYANIDNFYRFNDMSCLKIKNNIATFPIGFLSNNDGSANDGCGGKRRNAILNAVYIEMNINNNGQIVFIDSLGNKFVQNYLEYGTNYLRENDMRICDDCK
jgi:hypothetical protein